MKKIIKIVLALILTVSSLEMFTAPSIADNTPQNIDYVAFGDSVAAGVRGGVGAPGSETGSDSGYTDKIAEKLDAAGILGCFDKDFCVSGMTAARLAKRSAVLNNPGSAQSRLVKNAEIVTLDIGANDLLAPLYSYLSTLRNGKKPDHAIIADILKKMVIDLYFGSTGTDVQNNIETILKDILNANKKVKIYVMGYYNPLPVLAATYKIDMNQHVEYFNAFIREAISDITAKNKGASITYVDTMEAMAKHPDKNLVPTDIHPTETGYSVIAEEFWKKIKPALR